MELSFEILANYDQLVKMQGKLEQFKNEYDSVCKKLATENVAPLLMQSIQKDIDNVSNGISSLSAKIIDATKSINASSSSDLQSLSGNASDAIRAIGLAADEQKTKLSDFWGSVDVVRNQIEGLNDSASRMSGAINSISNFSSKMEGIGQQISSTTDPQKLASYNNELNKYSEGIAECGSRLSDWNIVEINHANISEEVAQKQAQLSSVIADQTAYVENLKKQVAMLNQQWLAASGTEKLKLWDEKTGREDVLTKEIAKLDMMKVKANELSIAFSAADSTVSNVSQKMGDAISTIGNTKMGDGIRQSFEEIHSKCVVARDSLKQYNEEFANISNQSARILQLRDAISSLDAEAQSGAVAKLEAEMRSCSQSIDQSYASLAKMHINTKAFDNASAAASKTISDLGESIKTQTEVVESHRAEVQRLQQAYSEATDSNKASIQSQLETAQQSLKGEETALTTMQNTLHSVRADYEQMMQVRKAVNDGIVASDQKAAQSQQEVRKQTQLSSEEAKKQKKAVQDLAGTWKQFLGTIGVAAGLKAFITQMIEVNARMEQMKTSLYGIMQSKSAADQLFSSIRDVSSHSAIGLGSLTGVAQQFVAFGESASRIPKLLEAMNEVSMGSEQKFNRLASSLQMMAAMGQVNTRTIRSMITAGFNPLIAISRKTGESMSDLMKKVKKGTIPVSEITNSFISATEKGGMFYKMNDKMSGTLSYQFAVMKKNVAGFFLELGKANDGTIHNVTKLIVTLTKHLKDFAEAAKIVVAFAGIKTGAYLAGQAIIAMSTAMKVATGATIGLTTAMKASGWGTIISIAAAASIAVYDLCKSTNEANSALSNYNKAVIDATGDAEKLFTILDNTDTTTKVHQDTLKELVDKYEEYGIHIDTSKGLLNDEANITQQLIEKKEILIGLIREEASERAKAEQYKKYQDERNEKYTELSETATEELKGKIATFGKNAGKEISEGMANGLSVAIVSSLSNSEKKIGEASRKYKYSEEEFAKKNKALNSLLMDLGKSGKYWLAAEVGKDGKGFISDKTIEKLKAIKRVSEITGISFRDMSADMQDSLVGTIIKLDGINDKEQDFSNTVGKTSEELDFNSLKLRYNKMSVEQLGSTIRDFLQNYQENDINFHINVDDAQVPKWMKNLGLSSDSYKSNAAYYAALLKEMQGARKKTGKAQYRRVGKEVMSEERVANRLAQYQKAAENKKSEEDKAAAEKEEKEKEEAKAERKRQAAQRKREAAQRKIEERNRRIKEATDNYKSSIKDAVSDLTADNEQQNNDLADDGVEKSMRDAELKYDKAVKDADSKIENVAKSLHALNKAKGSVAKSVEQLKKEILASGESSSEYGALIKAYNGALALAGKTLQKSQKEIVDGLRETYDKDNKDRSEKVKKLRADIAALEKLASKATSQAEKKELNKLHNNAQVQLDWVSQSKDAWNDYYEKYGTFLEKRKALEEKFLYETTGLDQDSAQYKLKVKDFNAANKALEFDEVKKQLNWEDVFGDLSSLSKSALAELQSQLETLIKNDKNLSIESIKAINEAINKVRAEQTKKGSLIGGLFSSVRNLKEKSQAAKTTQAQVQRVGGGSLWKRYQNASTTEEKAEIRAEKVYDPVSGELKTFGDMLDKAAKSTKDLSEAQKTAQSSIKSVASGFTTMSNLGKDVSNMLGKFGVTMPEGLETMFDGFGEIGSSLDSFDLTKPGSFLDVGNYVRAITGVFSGIADVFSGMFKMIFGKSDTLKAYENERKHYEKLSGIWSDLIEKKKQYIEMSFGDGAKEAIKEVEALYKAEEKSLQTLATKYLQVRNTGAHSYGYRIDRDLGTKGLQAMSQAAGVQINSVSDLTNLSYDQLVAAKGADNGEYWAKLPVEMQDYLDKLIECKKATQDFQEDTKEKMTGIKFDDMYSNFMSVLEDMSSGADDFVNSVKDKMRKALIDNTMGKEVEAWTKDFTERYQKQVEADGGKLTEEDARKFQQELEEKSNYFTNKRNDTLNNVGLGGEASDGSQTKGFAAASESSIEELSGRALAQTEALYQIRDIQNVIQSSVKNIEYSIGTVRDIQENSYLELVEIRKNTGVSSKAISGVMNEVSRIRKKIENL